jgi:hypothetical protein
MYIHGTKKSTRTNLRGVSQSNETILKSTLEVMKNRMEIYKNNTLLSWSQFLFWLGIILSVSAGISVMYKKQPIKEI